MSHHARLALALGACGSDGIVDPPSPPPPPPPPVRTAIFSGSGSLPSLTVNVVPFTTSSTGTLDVTVDWTFPASTIGVT